MNQYYQFTLPQYLQDVRHFQKTMTPWNYFRKIAYQSVPTLVSVQFFFFVNLKISSFCDKVYEENEINTAPTYSKPHFSLLLQQFLQPVILEKVRYIFQKYLKYCKVARPLFAIYHLNYKTLYLK